MASRKEEKERLREERMEREAAERRKASAKRRAQLVFGGLLAAAAVAAILVAVLAGGGDDEEPTANGGDDRPAVAIPGVQIRDLDEAAKAAGCKVETFTSEGRTHIGDEETFDDYKTNPPTSGNHRNTPAEDGIYEPGNEPAKEALVHTLEHGRVVYHYKPGTPPRRISQLETLVNEPFKGVEGYHQVLVQNNTEMTEAVAAVAWTQKVGCPEFNDKVFDVLRAFREKYVDKGPELVA